MDKEDFDLVVMVLHSYKNITPTHAKLVVSMWEKGSALRVSEVSKLLSEIGGSDHASRADGLLKGLEGKGLVSRVQENPKKYQAVPPSQVFVEINEINNDFKKQIEALEQAQEVYDFEKEDPLKLSTKLKNETDIISCMYRLLRAGNHLSLFLKDKKEFNDLRIMALINNNFKTQLKKKIIRKFDGISNCIIIKNSKGLNKGVILLLKRPVKKGDIRIYGNLLMDKDLADLLSSEKEV